MRAHAKCSTICVHMQNVLPFACTCKMFNHLRAHAKCSTICAHTQNFSILHALTSLRHERPFFAEGIKLVHFSDNHFIFFERFSEFGLFGWVVFGVWGLAGRGILLLLAVLGLGLDWPVVDWPMVAKSGIGGSLGAEAAGLVLRLLAAVSLPVWYDENHRRRPMNQRNRLAFGLRLNSRVVVG